MEISKHVALGREKGFTLVELLVVIAIIGVLSTLLLLQLGTARAKARDAKRISDINQIQAAVEQYYDDNGGFYPTGITDANLGIYLTNGKVPKDPVTGNAYGYAYKAATNPTHYSIWTNLEFKNTSALNGDADIDSSGWSGQPKVGANESCVGAFGDASYECVYDQGQK